MIIKHFKVGWLATNCYIIACEKTKEAVLIDPGSENKNEINQIMDYIKQKEVKIRYIINTHSHPDHIAGNNIMKNLTGALILIFKYHPEIIPTDGYLKDQEIIEVGTIKLKVLHTPGHTKDGICLVGDKEVFTGDTLFSGSIGRTDFSGGSYKELIQSIKTKLLPLPDNYRVYPGHESFTTIGNEKKYNPFLQ